MSDLVIRPPRESEFPAVRVLLPEAAGHSGKLFQLAFESKPSPSIVGALSYQDLGDSLSGLRLHVVQNRRRSKIGSRMVALLADQARSLGRTKIYADADIKNEVAAQPFLTSTGFTLVGTLTAVETDVEPIVAQSHRFEERLAKAQAFPEGSRVVSIEEAPLDQILKMHGDHIAHAPMMAGLLRDFHPEKYPESVVLMLGDRVIAFALVQVIGEVFYVPAWVTLPEHRGKHLGSLLFGVVADRMRGRYEPGSIKRIRFEYLDAAVYTAKLVREYGHTIVRIAARFERLVEPARL
jgi:GNAT superfamily N-acetyltransferase